MCIPRQSRPPSMQLRQQSCRWCFRAKRTQRHQRLYRVALQREDHRGRELAGRKGTQKRAQKRALLGPRWFRQISASALERLAGTTRLELATSAVTVLPG